MSSAECAKLESMEILCIISSLMFHQENENNDNDEWDAGGKFFFLCYVFPDFYIKFERKAIEVCSGDHFFSFILEKIPNAHSHLIIIIIGDCKNSFRNDDSGIPVVGCLKDMELKLVFVRPRLLL